MHTVAYQIDLPHPPQHIIDQARACIDTIDLEPVKNKANAFGPEYTQRKVRINDLTYITRYQKKYEIQGWQQWCRENIDPDCFHSGVAVNDGPSAYHGPHADAGRTWALFYLVESGGPDSTTSWWQHPEHPLVLDESLYPKAAWDYDDLRLVARARFQQSQWYMFNGRVLHSVENVAGRRISLQTNILDISRLQKWCRAIG
jgi:hypothetical protein